MARPTLDQIRGLGDFSTAIDWDLSFLMLPSAVSVSSDDINWRCESTTIPKKTGEPSTVQIRGLVPVRQPGIYVPDGTIVLNLVGTVDSVIEKFIRDWREACYTQGTAMALPKRDVEAKIRLTLLDRQKKARWRYDLIGAFIQENEGGELSGSEASIMKPTITLAYDDFTDGPA